MCVYIQCRVVNECIFAVQISYSKCKVNLEELNSHLPPKASQMALYYSHDIQDQDKRITQLSQSLFIFDYYNISHPHFYRSNDQQMGFKF